MLDGLQWDDTSFFLSSPPAGGAEYYVALLVADNGQRCNHSYENIKHGVDVVDEEHGVALISVHVSNLQ